MSGMRLLRSRSFPLVSYCSCGYHTVVGARAASYEQARSTGEKNLGVAVLGMLLGIPTLIFGSGGLVCVIVSLVSV